MRFQVLELSTLADSHPVAYSAGEGTQSTKVSPKAPHAIAFEGYLIADDWHIVCLSLSNEHTVKWILVRARQKSGANTMLCGNGYKVKTFAFDLAREISCQVSSGRPFRQPDLDRDFPSRSSTYYQRVSGFCNNLSSGPR